MADLKPKPPATVWGQAFERALQAGFSVVIGFLGGYYADRWLGTPYLFMALGLLVGGIAGVRALLQIPVQPPTEASANSNVAAESDPGRPTSDPKRDPGSDAGPDQGLEGWKEPRSGGLWDDEDDE